MCDNLELIKKAQEELELGSIGFKIIDSLPDVDLAYTVYKLKNIEVIIEPEEWYCELYIGPDAIRMEGVKTREDIIKLTEFVYGKENC